MISTYLFDILTAILFVTILQGVKVSGQKGVCSHNKQNETLLEGYISFPGREWRILFQTKFDCYFPIRSLPSSKLVLHFWDLKLDSTMPECQNDYLEIFIGCYEVSIGRFCTGNSDVPHLVFSNDNCMKLHFHWSGRQGQGGVKWQGFKAYYFSEGHMSSRMKAIFDLRSVRTKAKGTLYSPGWPVQYRNWTSRNWIIKPPSRCGTKVSFMDVNFGKAAAFSTCLRLSGFNSMGEIGTSMSICTSTRPFYKIYKNYDYISLNFSSKVSVTNGRGILVGYLHFCNNTAGKNIKISQSEDMYQKIILPSSTVIMILLLAVSIKIFLYRRHSPATTINEDIQRSQTISGEQVQVSTPESYDREPNEQHFDQVPIQPTTSPPIMDLSEKEKKSKCLSVPVEIEKAIATPDFPRDLMRVDSGCSELKRNSQNVVSHNKKKNQETIVRGVQLI